MKSVIQTKKECYLCRVMLAEENTRQLESHHIFGGSANRRKSEADGLKVWLCHEHHQGNDGVHFNPVLMEFLKKRGQLKYEETHTREEFIKRYGRNYL